MRLWFSAAHRSMGDVPNDNPVIHGLCPVCHRRNRLGVIVGIIQGDPEGHPVFYGGIRRRRAEGEPERLTDLRPWLDPVITCRRGHRLQVPAGQSLARAMSRTPAGALMYLKVAPPSEPIPLRLEAIARR
jgi:hypothetical protein